MSTHEIYSSEEERLRAEVLALRCELRALRALCPNDGYATLTGTWVLDLVTQELVWSANTYKIFRVEPDSVDDLFDTFFNAVHPDDRSIVQQASRAAMFNREPYIVDHRIVLPDGEVRQVFENAEVLYDNDGAPLRMIGAVVDLTERRALEADLTHTNRLEAIGSLAGGVAHDFNNLLGVILLTTSTALEDAPPKSVLAEDLSLIQHAAKRGANLAGKLLSLARKQPLSLRQRSISQVFEGLSTVLGGVARDQIELQITTELDAAVRVDETHIEQALLNLCLNSIEAMPNGGSLSIAATSVQVLEGTLACAPGQYVRIDVSDTGEGMTPEVLDKIFQAFYTTKPKGTGLGLATVYGITRQHHGDIRVVSTVDVGTRFSLFLPQLRDPAQITGDPSITHSPLAGTASVLMAEDDATLLRLMARILQDAGYRVRAVPNGQQAVDAITRRPEAYDLLLIDALMPVLGGVDAVKQIRELTPTLPVLFCSGYSVDLVDSDVLHAKRTSFLAKPFEPRTLLKAVQDALASPSHRSE